MAARRILSLRVLEWPRLAPPDTKSVSTAPPDEGLVRALGLGSAILFVLGSVIGSGIFLTTGVMAAALAVRDPDHCRLGRRRRHRAERRPDVRGNGRDVPEVRRGLRLPARGVRSADCVPLWMGGAPDVLQRRHRGRRGGVCRLLQLLRARPLDRARALVDRDAGGSLDGFGRADRRRHGDCRARRDQLRRRPQRQPRQRRPHPRQSGRARGAAHPRARRVERRRRMGADRAARFRRARSRGSASR